MLKIKPKLTDGSKQSMAKPQFLRPRSRHLTPHRIASQHFASAAKAVSSATMPGSSPDANTDWRGKSLSDTNRSEKAVAV